MRCRLFNLLLIFILCLSVLHGNSDTRTWALDSGKQLKAELISCDLETGIVKLKFNNAEDRNYNFDDFGVIDQAWLVEWVEFETQLKLKLEKVEGTFEHFVTEGIFPTDLYVYYPSASKQSSKPLPALILFHPGGKAARYCMRHIEAAEQTGLIIIACGGFRNTGDDFKKESAMLERFREAFPQILERVDVDPKRVYMGGTSGGACKAFYYSAWVKFPWAGIYSNVGWLGGKKYYNLPYPDGMRIAIVNGNQDGPANGFVKSDSEVLQKAGNKVAVIMFEGGHQVPPFDSQIKAFNWLLDQEDFDEL